MLTQVVSVLSMLLVASSCIHVTSSGLKIKPEKNAIFHLDKLCLLADSAAGQKQGVGGVRTGNQGQEMASYPVLLPNMEL